MVCKFLHHVVSMVTPPDGVPYALSMYVQATDCEHAIQCMLEYAKRHCLQMDILRVDCVYNFLIADQYDYLNSRVYDKPIEPFGEALDLP